MTNNELVTLLLDKTDKIAFLLIALFALQLGIFAFLAELINKRNKHD